MDDEVQEWPDEFGEPALVARWHWTFPAVRLFAFASDVSHAAGHFWRGVGGDVAAHANYQVRQDEFMREAARELETILEGND